MNQQGKNKKLTAEEILKEVNARIAEEEASHDVGQEIESEQVNLGYLPVPPPFPVEAFPPLLQKVIYEVTAAYAVPVEVVVAALLSASGGCIGRTRGIVIKDGWTEFANLWVATVGVSGLGKSPATNRIFHPIWQHEEQWHRDFKDAVKAYEAKLAEWKKDRDQPEPGDPPAWRQLILDDATTEALTEAFDANPRGILWNRDEMAGFILDIDRYIQRDAGSKTRFMSSYDSGQWKINRRDKSKNSFIPHATLSILGTVQPAVLPKIFSSLDAASGFLPRFLFIWAVREVPPFWTDATVSRESHDYLAELFDRLLHFDFQGDGEPYIVRVSDMARKAFVDWYDVQVAEPWFKESTQIYEALLAKLRGQSLRICLILHCLESASLGLPELGEVSLPTMENAIKIADCLKIHQKNTWEYILKEGGVTELSPIQKRVARAILELEPEIETGMLSTARITKVVNVGMAKKFQFSSTRVGKIAAALGFNSQKMPDGKARGILVEPSQLQKYKSLLNVSKASEAS